MNNRLQAALAICSFAVLSFSNSTFAANTNAIVHSPLTNYSLKDRSKAKSGATYCKKFTSSKCVPIKNKSKTELWVDFDNNDGATGDVSQAPAHEILADINYDQANDDIVKIVDFKDRSKVIYLGVAKNNEGLKCKNKKKSKKIKCKPWK